ncbi:MAG: FMN-binding negative transcriptional regulator [Oscillatoriales cyanobacterium C42_A2020_001]|nr:FMN-binding negative transcriptional regulator [Leptolyngbyaceae cyanobacterium C42_A2020_001]
MYIPAAFREEDLDKLIAFMQSHSFAALVSIQNQIPVVSHIPLAVTRHDNNVVKLTGHLAKANPQWQAFQESESLAVFTGSHAYISPSLYEKRENVPTWNYIAVHAYGRPEIITLNDAPEQMNQMIDAMMDTYSADYKAQWQSLSHTYREGMMHGIVGFEMVVTRLEGKYKLSQNRSEAEQRNIAHTLLQSHDPAAQAVGKVMQQHLE